MSLYSCAKTEFNSGNTYRNPIENAFAIYDHTMTNMTNPIMEVFLQAHKLDQIIGTTDLIERNKLLTIYFPETVILTDTIRVDTIYYLKGEFKTTINTKGKKINTPNGEWEINRDQLPPITIKCVTDKQFLINTEGKYNTHYGTIANDITLTVNINGNDEYSISAGGEYTENVVDCGYGWEWGYFYNAKPYTTAVKFEFDDNTKVNFNRTGKFEYEEGKLEIVAKGKHLGRDSGEPITVKFIGKNEAKLTFHGNFDYTYSIGSYYYNY